MRRRSLVVKLLLFTLAAVILPSLVIAIANHSISSATLKDSIAQQQAELARRIAEQVNGEIRHAKGVLAIVAHSSFFSAGSRVDQYEALRSLMAEVPDFQEVMFVNADGRELLKIKQNALNPQLGKRTENVHESFVGQPFFSVNRSPTILLGEPIRSYSNPMRTGALLAKMSFASLRELIGQAQVGPHGLAYIVDERGNLLAHPDASRVFAHPNLASQPAVREWITHPGRPTELISYVNARGDSWVSLAYPIALLGSAVVIEQPRSDVYASLERMRNLSIGWSVFSVVFFIAAAVAVGWRILQPLRQMRAAAEAVGRGHLNVQLDIHTHDELEDLGNTFQQMARSLAELERLRGDLINMVVHDLKMPLSSILPCLDALSHGDLGSLNDDQLRFVQMARRSGQDMLMMIQNLLDVAKMEEGKLLPHPEEFIPKDWAESVLSMFGPLAEAGRKRLKLVIADRLPTARADVPLLSRVLGNLISNALRHTAPVAGEVTVSVYQDGTQLAVEVRDNGEGIPEVDQQRIFEKFTQADDHPGAGQGTPTRLRLGSGLGLTFCKMVIEAHGGRITLYSQPKEGSLFTFRLPLAEPAPQPDEVAGNERNSLALGNPTLA